MLHLPKRQCLILVGGGHTHAVFLRMWAMNPRADTEILLISPTSGAAYSGMLPAAVAGFVDYEAISIDLRHLAKAAGAVYIDDELIGIDLPRRRILLREHPYFRFDLLSLNLGSQPRMSDIPGAALHCVGVKPVDRFLEHWENFRSRARRSSRLLIVGGGAGGVELALAMRAEGRLPPEVSISLVQSSPELLPQFSASARKSLERELDAKRISLHRGQAVKRVEAGRLLLDSGMTLDFDAAYWTTDAAPPACLRDSGLLLDEQGFALTDDTLLCEGQGGIFAVGDCASLRHQKRPKSGVYAVRLGKPLFQNVLAALEGRPLRPFKIQKKALALIGTGDRRAVASRGGISFKGSAMWRLKEAIDTRFMRRFADLPVPSKMSSPASENPKKSVPFLMRCAGCGAKVGAHILSDVLEDISLDFPKVVAESADRLEWGLHAREDVALWRSSPTQRILQSLDYFPALLDDPFRMGQIACNHAFSDILVKGAEPHSALVLAIIPWASERLAGDQLRQLLSGVATQLALIGASLAGGHTAEGEKLAIGLSVTGMSEGRILRKDGAKASDVLILSKPLGTGLIFAAEMQGKARASHLDAAVQSMLLSQHSLLPLLRKGSVHAATDITGFGLLGHLLEMLKPGQLKAELAIENIPLLDGSLALARLGISSSLFEANSHFQRQVRGAIADQSFWTVLGDPQTSGGFLLSVAPEAADDILRRMREKGFPEAQLIGKLREREDKSSPLIEIKEGTLPLDR